MMVWVKLMFGYLVRIFFSDLLLGHLFTHSRIQLAELRSLSNLVPSLIQILRGFNRSASRGGPDRQWLQHMVCSFLIDRFLSFGFSVLHQTFGHFLCIILP